MAFKIILGDITKSDRTAIVNAANPSLLGGGGVDGAIHKAAGPELLEECRKFNGCPTGEARITRGYRLKARYIIHTPGPKWRGGMEKEAERLESCYRNCFELAKKYAITDIDFPSISTGIYGFPVDQAAEIAIRVIAQYPDIDVRMVCFDEQTKEAYQKAQQRYFLKL